MVERTRPVCSGVNGKGELVWETVPMARWQMEMFRVRYYGDFMAHWLKRQFADLTGHESERDIPSMELRSKNWKPNRPTHGGD